MARFRRLRSRPSRNLFVEREKWSRVFGSIFDAIYHTAFVSRASQSERESVTSNQMSSPKPFRLIAPLSFAFAALRLSTFFCLTAGAIALDGRFY